MEGWIPTTPKEGRAQSWPPSPSTGQFGLGEPRPSPQSRGKAVSPSSAQGDALVLRLPRREKSSPTGFLFVAPCEGWVQPSSRFPVLWVTAQSQ